MRPHARLLVTIAAGLGMLALAAGCAADDPLEAITVTTQPAVSLPADGVFPPVADDVTKPGDDKFVDLRGNDVVEIDVRDNVYDARFFVVDPGTQIVFTNRGANTHNVTPAAEGAFAAITTEALSSGPQSIVLDAPGDYPFFCTVHGTAKRGQTGWVVVGNG
ncbi:MAG: plastocyanin/azurin family copper-binding protein [Acidimicrobiales bacterium]